MASHKQHYLQGAYPTLHPLCRIDKRKGTRTHMSINDWNQVDCQRCLAMCPHWTVRHRDG